MVWKNGKILFESPRHAHQVQTALFQAGFTWEDGTQKYKAKLYAIHWASECMNIWAIGNAQVYKYAGVERQSVFMESIQKAVYAPRYEKRHHWANQREELRVILEEGTKYLLASGLTYPTEKREMVTDTGKLQRMQFIAMLSFCIQAVKGANISPTAQLFYARKIGIQCDNEKYFQQCKNWEPYRPKGKAFEQETLIENLKHLICTTK